jgi:dTDP-4-amino-4,6-dideoxygalactose transaminase
LDPLRLAVLADKGVVVIEDRAHRLDGQDVVGSCCVYSFEHSKVASAGQGGLVVSTDASFLRALAAERDALPYPRTSEVRRALRTSAVQSGLAAMEPAIGLGSALLRRLALRIPAVSAPSQTDDERSGGHVAVTKMHPASATAGLASVIRAGVNLDHRRRLCGYYQAHLGDLVPVWARVDLPLVRQPILVDDADRTSARLRRAGLDLGTRWFDAPIHPRGSRADYVPGTAPRAERLASQVLSLPTHLRVNRRTAAWVVSVVLDAAG